MSLAERVGLSGNYLRCAFIKAALSLTIVYQKSSRSDIRLFA